MEGQCGLLATYLTIACRYRARSPRPCSTSSRQVRQLRPISDEDATRRVSQQTHVDLVAQITALPVVENARRPSVARHRWRAAVRLVIAVAAAIALATSLGNSGTSVGPVDLGPAKAQALSFTTEGRFIRVIVRNPPSRRQALPGRAHRASPQCETYTGSGLAFAQRDRSGEEKPVTLRRRRLCIRVVRIPQTGST
jgi:hypothetical protein